MCKNLCIHYYKLCQDQDIHSVVVMTTVESTPSFDHESDRNSEDGFSASGSESLTGSSSAETDQEGHTTPEYVPGCFEGPEKTMEVVFKAGVGAEEGLRALTREQLDHLCTQAKCTILSKISSNYIDAYVLSESSLFIYKHKYIMKTCGTTTLLRCLSSLLQFADALGMQLTWKQKLTIDLELSYRRRIIRDITNRKQSRRRR